MPCHEAARVIYIVDPDAGVREGLSRLVRAAGLAVRSFATTAELLAAVERPASGCILLDITATESGAAELAGQLNARGIALPLIALSARHDTATRQRARALGSRFFMGKPVDDQALLDAIEWVIGTPEERAGQQQ